MIDVLPQVIALADQSDVNSARLVPLVTLEIRRVVGVCLLAPAGTLLLLYLLRPRPYVLAGAITWFAASVMLLVLSVDTIRPGPGVVSGRLVLGVWAVAALTFSAGLRFASVWFRAQAGVSRAFRWIAAGMITWVLFAAIFLQPASVLGPTIIVGLLWQVGAAVQYFRIARQFRFVGAILAGAGEFGIIAANTTVPLVTASLGGVSPWGATVTFINIVSVGLIMVGMFLLIFEDVIEELRKVGDDLRQSRDEMVSLAVTDPLTGCYNRRFLEEIETHELHQHRRYGLPLSLLYIDIDRFKAINDTRGHDVGDKVLQTIGTILRTQTRLADYVFRWGGDEFLVLLSTDESNARVKAQSIRQTFLDSAIVRTLPDAVDLSIGCVFVPPDTDDLSPLIDQADRDMYRYRRGLAG